jgi:dTDP-4-amino-4,6-dideoxygalactose transaminase
LHLQKAYQHLNHRKGDFPVTERVALEIVSLPMFPQLKLDQLALVTTSVKEFAVSKIGAAR